MLCSFFVFQRKHSQCYFNSKGEICHYFSWTDVESRNAVTRLEQAEKELSKVRGTLEKSRRARDVEQLFAENEALQHKLFSQEEEFRLQNRTLMDELGLVRCIMYIYSILRISATCPANWIWFPTQLVATNEKLEATLRASVGERLEATVQCDLADEEQAAERRQLEDRIRSGSLAVETLEQQLAELRRSAAEEADQLRSQLARAQAEADLTPGLRREIDERRDGEAKLSAEVQKLGDELNAAKTRAADVIGQMSADHSQELEVLRESFAESFTCEVRFFRLRVLEKSRENSNESLRFQKVASIK